MQTLSIVFHNLISLTICACVGYIARKARILNNEIVNGLSSLLMFALFPCMILASMQKPFSLQLLGESALLIFLSAAVFLFGGLLSWIACRLLRAPKEERGVYLYSMTFPNVIYMGLPVIQSIYGTGSVFYVTVTNIAFNLMVFSLGIRLIVLGYENGEAKPQKGIRFNMAMAATFVGLLLFLFSVRLPSIVNDGLEMIGSMTTPTAMIVIGAILAKCDILKLFHGTKMYVFIFIRLILVPAAVYFIMRWFIDGMLLGVIVLISAMPAGTLTAIFAERYKANAEFATKFVCLTTLLSVLSIPFISLLIL